MKRTTSSLKLPNDSDYSLSDSDKLSSTTIYSTTTNINIKNFQPYYSLREECAEWIRSSEAALKPR